MRARGAAALAVLLPLAGCDSGQVTEPSLPPPHIISGPLIVPTACATRAQSPDHPGEPSLAVDPTNPSQLVATWQENRSPDEVGNVVAVSHDGGSTWTRAALPSVLTCTGGPYVHATDPWVSIGRDGTVYLSALVARPRSSTGTTRDIVVSISHDHGGSWEAPVVLQSLTAPPAQRDKDAILADPRRPGVAYAVWVEYPVAGNAQPVTDEVVFARTTDAGRTWSKPASIYSGNDEAQQNQLLMTAGGVLLDVFIEGASLPGTPHPPPLPVKIRVMRSTNQGQTWSPPIDAASFTYTNAVDPGTGGQLRFFGQQITAAAAGNAVYVAWFEVHKDFSTILVARSEDAGLHWRAPPGGVRGKAPGFLSALAGGGAGTVGVVLFGLRALTARSARPHTEGWFSTHRHPGPHR